MSSLLNQNAESSDYIDGGFDTVQFSDASIIDLVAKKNELALNELYKRYAPLLFNYLRRLVKDQEIAEDLLQETFLAVWEGASAFKGRSTVKTWMFRIAHNLTMTWLRNKYRSSEEVVGQVMEFDDNPELLAIGNWQTEQIQSALDELSTNHRAVIELAFAYGLSYSEIANIIDRPVGTVKSRISYAIRHLEGILRRQGLNN